MLGAIAYGLDVVQETENRAGMARNETVHTAPDATSEETQLNRAITKPLLVAFVTGDILGAGIYAVAGEVAGEVGGAIWAPILLAFALALLTALSYAELVTKYPRAAGAALYVHKAFSRPFLTFMVAIAVMASGISSASTSALAFGGDYLGAFISFPQVLAAVLFLLVLAGINYRGISESIKVNLGLTLIEALGLVVVIVIGGFALSTGRGEVSQAFMFKEGASVPLAILGGTALAFFSFLGFEDSVNVAEETRNPRKAYPFALFAGLLIALAFYLLVVLTAAVIVPPGELGGSSAPLLQVVQIGAPAFPPRAFAIIALLAVSNTALINLIMASRLLYGLSDQGIVPALFSRVHSQRRTPWVAIIIVTIMAMLLVATGTIGALADTTVLLLLTIFTLVNIAVLVLRRETLDVEHFHAPTIVPVLGALSSAGLAISTIIDDPLVALRAVLLLAAGVLLWLINRAVHGRPETIHAEHLKT
jgi:APA family basic amino acid/polyamine antiporter